MSTTITSATDSSSWTSLQTLIANADANADGTVTESELVDAVSDDATNVAEQIVAAADSDGDGSMSLLEFNNFATTFSSATGLALLSAQEDSSAAVSFFAGLDSDGSATLSNSELAAGLTATDDTSKEAAAATTEDEDTTTDKTSTISEDVQALIDAIDTNGDGVFDKSDVALRVLQAAGEAEAKNDDEDLTSTLVTTLDSNGDGTLSDEELQAAGLA